MVSIRGFGRRRTGSKNPTTTQSVPTSPVIRPTSGKALSRKGALATELDQSLSDADYLSLLSFRPFTPFCPELNFRASCPAHTIEVGSGTDIHSAVNTRQSDRNSQVSEFSEGLENVEVEWKPVVEAISESPAVAEAVPAKLRDIFEPRGTSGEDSVPSRDTPASFNPHAMVSFIPDTRNSALPSPPKYPSEDTVGEGAPQFFDESVRDLVQDKPDFPIGGTEAAPMAPRTRFAIETVTIPRPEQIYVETLPAGSTDRYGDGSMKSRTKQDSSSAEGFLGLENRPMVTCPETPEDRRSSEGIACRDSEYDDEDPKQAHTIYRQLRVSPMRAGRSGFYPSSFHDNPATKVKDFADSQSLRVQTRLKQSLDSTSQSLEETTNLANLGDGPFSMSDVSQAPPVPEVSSPPKAGDLPEGVPQVTDTEALLSASALTEVKDTETVPDAPAIADTAKALPAVPDADVPAVPVSGVDLPSDVAGNLPVPDGLENGQKSPLSKRVTNKGQKYIRKCRAKVLKKQVLVPVIGRQLAGPTSEALKLISDGLPVDTSTITGAVSPPAGIPAAPVPA